MAKENEETLYGYFRRNRGRNERFWSEDDFRGQSDDRIAIFIKSDVALTMKAKESAKKCDARSEFTKLVTPFVYFLVSIRVVVVVVSRPRQ